MKLTQKGINNIRGSASTLRAAGSPNLIFDVARIRFPGRLYGFGQVGSVKLQCATTRDLCRDRMYREPNRTRLYGARTAIKPAGTLCWVLPIPADVFRMNRSCGEICGDVCEPGLNWSR